MRKLFGAFGLAVVLSLSGGAAADASTVTDFWLDGSGGLRDSYTFTNDGIELTVTAGTFSGGSIAGGAKVGQYSRGLGVTSHVSDSHFVDGRLKNDLLILAFDTDIRLHSLTFAYNDSNDDFRFFFEGSGGTLVDWGSNIDIPGSSFFSVYVFSGAWVGDRFGVGAQGTNDEFKLKGVSVERLATVPLPPAFALLGLALALFGAAARRRPSGPATT